VKWVGAEGHGVPGEENHNAVGTACQGCLVAVDIVDDAEHADRVVRIGVGCEGVEVGGKNSGRRH
jgi:hypothetical protein